jgi:caa(3)-type oxidase subunit IV
MSAERNQASAHAGHSGHAGHGGHAGPGAVHAHHPAHEEAAHIKHYTKIYVQLLVLFLISVMGPVLGEMIGSHAIVLVTAFGIALVKAYLVCAHFMHLNVEKRYIGYLLTTAIVFMLLFYAGVSPDVMEHRGRNWENVAAREETERALKAHGAHPEGGQQMHTEH